MGMPAGDVDVLFVYMSVELRLEAEKDVRPEVGGREYRDEEVVTLRTARWWSSRLMLCSVQVKMKLNLEAFSRAADRAKPRG